MPAAKSSGDQRAGFVIPENAHANMENSFEAAKSSEPRKRKLGKKKNMEGSSRKSSFLDTQNSLEISNKNSSACVNALVSGIIAVFYTALIIVSVLVCLYSIKTLYRTSNIPVTSTTIEQRDDDFEEPSQSLLLLYLTKI